MWLEPRGCWMEGGGGEGWPRQRRHGGERDGPGVGESAESDLADAWLQIDPVARGGVDMREGVRDCAIPLGCPGRAVGGEAQPVRYCGGPMMSDVTFLLQCDRGRTFYGKGPPCWVLGGGARVREVWGVGPIDCCH